MTDLSMTPGWPLPPEAGVPIPPTDEDDRPTEGYRGGVMPPADRGEDVARDELMHELENRPERPLTDEEKKAAQRDPGKPPHREQDPPSR